MNYKIVAITDTQYYEENFSLKSENASYKPVGLGFYVKKSTDDFTF